MLDTQTLIVVISLVALLSALIMFLLWRINTAQHGVFLWFIASLITAVAYIGPVLFPGHAFGVLVNNVLFVASMMVMLEGALQFRGQQPGRRWLIALVVLPLVAVFVWMNADDSLLRYRVIDILSVSMFVAIAVIMTRHTSSREELAVFGVAGLFCMMVAALIGARWFMAMVTSELDAMAGGLTFNNIMFTGYILFAVGWTYSVTLACYYRAQQSALKMAREDPLTGLPNRRSIDEMLQREIGRSGRNGKKFSLIVMDLDGFKSVNDTQGHAAGDEVLIQVARRLEAQVRDADFIARLGGDEFLVLLHNTRSDEDTSIAIKRFRDCLDAPIPVNGREVTISLSAGAAEWGTDGTTADQLLQAADRRMYSRKGTDLISPMHGQPSPGL